MRYKSYEAAWMLMTYRGRKMLAPLPDVHPGINIVVAGGQGGEGGGGVRDSPFPMPPEVLRREEERKAAAAGVTADPEGPQSAGGALTEGAIYG